MRIPRVASCLVVFGLAGLAHADILWATGSSVVSSTSNFVQDNTTGGSGNVSADDGSVFGWRINAGAYGTPPLTFTYDFFFVSGFKHPGDTSVRLFLGTVDLEGGTLVLNTVQWRDGTGGTATYNVNLALTSFGSGSNLSVSGTDVQGNYATAGGFSFDNFQTLRLSFTYDLYNAAAADRSFEFDAVSNPEPGTMALFGLGALGLGGIAWRRRRAKAAAKKS